MRRIALLIALFALAAAPNPLRAATADGRFAPKEAGLASCGQFVKEREQKSDAYFQFIGWVAGYLSAYNRFTADTFDVASWESMGLMDNFLANICSQNQDKPFIGAVDFLIKQLEPTKLSAFSEIVEAKVGDNTAHLYKEALSRAQQKLAEKGLYKGSPDGAFGDGTRKALEAFQKQAGIPTTGLPDQLTLLRLFGAEPAPKR